MRRAYDRKYELWQLRFLETKCTYFFITTFGRDVCGQLSFAEEKLSKFMSTTDNHLIPSDLALAIWSLTMPVKGLLLFHMIEFLSVL